MMTLEERYKQRKKEYDEYSKKKIEYDVKLQSFIENITKCETNAFKYFDTLDKDIKDKIGSKLPDRTIVCDETNVTSRIEQWRVVYKMLEQEGLRLLEE